MGKETDQVSVDKNPRSNFMLIEGQWGENVPWKMYISGREPKPELCTAAFCVITYRDELILVQNKSRGWELPGGHVDEGEQLKDALQREVLEEAGVVIENPRMFGYKKISPKTPMPHRDRPGESYPFPHSYILYYLAIASEASSDPSASEIERTTRVGLREARRLLVSENSLAKIVDYLVESSQIKIKE